MIEVNIAIPAQDVAALKGTFDKYVAWFNKGPREAVKKTCVYIVKSLSASTKIGAKTRRIVKNPDYAKTGTKRERQLMHIAEWNRAHGKPVRMPQAFQKYAIQRYGQRGGPWYRGVNGETSAEARAGARLLEMSKPNVYEIRKRGLAKSSWGWMLGKLGKPSMVDQANIAGTTEVTESPRSDVYAYIDLANKLGYITKAMKTRGKHAVNTVLYRANRSMIYEMEGHIKGAKRAAGLRAA